MEFGYLWTENKDSSHKTDGIRQKKKIIQE
jgi:hypothetical protein